MYLEREMCTMIAIIAIPMPMALAIAIAIVTDISMLYNMISTKLILDVRSMYIYGERDMCTMIAIMAIPMPIASTIAIAVVTDISMLYNMTSTKLILDV